VSHVRVGDLLVQAGVITAAQLGQALRMQQKAGGRLGTNLVQIGAIDGVTLARFLSQQLRIPAVSAASVDRVSPKVLARLSAKDAERLQAVPIREDTGKLWVAFVDPGDREAVDEVAKLVGSEVRPMVAPELLMQYALEKHYQVRRSGRGLSVDDDVVDIPIVEEVDAAAEQAPLYMPTAVGQHVETQTGYLDETEVLPAGEVPSGPISIGPMNLGELAGHLGRVTTDEEALDLAIRFLHQDIARVWIFLLRGGVLHAFRGRGMPAADVLGVTVPADQLPLVESALTSGQVLAGRLMPAALGALAGPLGVYEETLGFIVPVRIARRAVGVIFGVDASLAAMRRKDQIDGLTEKLDHALHINYLRRLLAAT